MRFVAGTHRHAVAHRPLGDDKTAVALEATAVDVSTAVDCPLPAGGFTVHQPHTLHGTGPNRTDATRLAWTLQFRPQSSWTRPSRARQIAHVAKRRLELHAGAQTSDG
jgi:ectoine hydroxylase-related dioxygenase (phytanoyl-CoA dioxygenase family)